MFKMHQIHINLCCPLANANTIMLTGARVYAVLPEFPIITIDAHEAENDAGENSQSS